MTFSIHRAADRFVTETESARTRHSFSFGAHYDPANTHFGVLLAHNEELVQPGPGYEAHPHRNVEIVSWVLKGVLRHEDSTGAVAHTPPGVFQVLSAGTGVTHSERSADDRPVHFIQMWLAADRSGPPTYQQAQILAAEGLTLVAAGSGDAPLQLRQPAATLFLGRGSFALPAARFVHLSVNRGAASVDRAGTLSEGDALRVTDCPQLSVTAAAGAELLIWVMGADPAHSRA